MTKDELREEALRLLKSHVGMIPGSVPELTDEDKDAIWAEMVKEIQDIE